MLPAPSCTQATHFAWLDRVGHDTGGILPTEILAVAGFLLADYSIVANGAIQTLGAFLSSNQHRPWWLLWLFASTVLVAVLVYGWVFLGLLAGRELAFSLNCKLRLLRHAGVMIAKDAAKATAGLTASISLAIALPVVSSMFKPASQSVARANTIAPALAANRSVGRRTTRA